MKVIFYFTAKWCSPCKKMLPMVEEFITENENLGLIIIDVEEEQEMIVSFNIQHVPTLMLFENDEFVKSIDRSMSKNELREFVYGE